MSAAYDSMLFPLVTPDEQASHYYRLRTMEAPQPTTKLDVEAIADVNNMAIVFEAMKRHNGQAAGPDRIRYPDIGRSELMQILRTARKAILDGSYRPGPARNVNIPKAGGTGFRTLTVRNVIDRVIAGAVAEAVTAHWEKIFLDGSHGFRPKRSHLTLLADLQEVMATQDRCVLVSDDVRSAFPSVTIDLAIGDLRKHLANNPLLMRLIESILRGDDPNRKIGLDQGCPLMPVAVNIHLHEVFDAKTHTLGVSPGNPTPCFRYVDNIVAAGRDVAEGQHVLQQTTKWLRDAGLALKGENGGIPIDLKRNGRVQLLGFVLSKQGDRVGYELTRGALGKLREKLLKAHESTSPMATATSVIKNWIGSHGPAFRKQQNHPVDLLLHTAYDLGFHEIPGREFYLEACTRAWAQWTSLVSRRKRLPSL